MADRTVLHHTLLQEQGGAARVADMLAESARRAGATARRQWEMANDGSAGVSPNRVLRDLGGDLLHLHSTADWDTLLQAARPAGNAVVLTLHDCSLLTGGCPYPLDCEGIFQGCYDPCPRRFPDATLRQERRRRLLAELAPVCVSPSSWLARLARDSLAALECRVVPNGVQWPEAMPDRRLARRLLGASENARIALFAAHGGEQAAYKAGAKWRDIWDNIKASLEDVLGFFVGGAQAGRDGDVFLWPYVDRTTMHTVLSAADVLVYPSYADNHPLLVLEAMAANLPVVAWAAGGIPEQIRDRETGLLSRVGDVAGLARHAIALLAAPSKAKRFSEAAWTTGRKRFCTERMYDDYTRIYRTLRTD